MINNVLKDFVLFLDSGKEVGQVASFKPPALNVVEEDVRMAGMDAALKLDMGMEPLVTEFTMAGVHRGVLERWGLRNGFETGVTVRGSVQDTQTGLPKPVYHKMRGTIRSIEQSEYVAGQRATIAVKMSLSYYEVSHTLVGVPVILIDIPNYVRLINGVDQLAAQRVILGR